MFGKLKGKAMALSFALAMVLVTFIGIGMAAEPIPLPATVTVAIADGSDVTDDGIAYLGDTFIFAVDAQPFIDESDLKNVSDNLTATLHIDTTAGVDIDLVFTDYTEGISWNGSWLTDEAGTFDWVVNVSENATNFKNATGQITVMDVPAYNTAVVDTYALVEDETYELNLTGAFTPDGLTLVITWPETWVIDELADMVWNITPPADFFGEANMTVNASDSYVKYVEQMFFFNVGAVNDGPMLDHIMVGETQVDFEEYNYTWLDEELNETLFELRNTAMLDTDEEMYLNFSIVATDIDDENLTYGIDVLPEGLELTAGNESAPENVTLTPADNLNGEFWMVLNVSDAALDYDLAWIKFTVDNVNDDPVIVSVATDLTEVKTGENVTLTADVTDIDADDVVTITWMDGETEIGTGASLELNFTTAGNHTIKAVISDGTTTIESTPFNITVELAVIPNEPPTITSISLIPDLDLLDIPNWEPGKAEKGQDLLLVCYASDPDGDDLTYVWTHDQDAAWSMTEYSIVVSADDLEKGKTYIFTCTVSDGTEEVTLASDSIEITEAKEDPSTACFTIAGVIIGIIVLLVIIIIIVLVIKGGKKEEEEEPPMEQPMEEQPMGYEQPPMEQPVEAPVEQPPMEQPVEAPVEQPPVEQPVEAPVEQPPVEPAAPPAPEPPMPPAPEQPVPPQPPVAPPQPPQ